MVSQVIADDRMMMVVKGTNSMDPIINWEELRKLTMPASFKFSSSRSNNFCVNDRDKVD